MSPYTLSVRCVSIEENINLYASGMSIVQSDSTLDDLQLECLAVSV
jgi:hypothetical protein